MMLYHSNLTSIPENLHELWTPIAFLSLDFGQLTRFPSTLSQMQDLLQVNLVGNRMQSLEEAADAFANHNMQYIRLSNSTLQELPSPMDGSIQQFIEIDLECTQLKEVPASIRDWDLNKLNNQQDVAHSLYGSPYCDVVLPASDQAQQKYQKQVCGTAHGTAGPPSLIHQQRPL